MEDRRLAAIMFTDIVGYTSIMADDEQAALKMVNEQREIIKPLIDSHTGQWLKEMGDGSLSSFSSATNAVKCAIEIQKQLENNPRFKIRIGIHLGDVVFTENDVFGDGVNIAARIEPTAEAGGIAISGSVYDTLSNNKYFETVFLGEKQLKNVGRPLRIYAVSNNGLPVGDNIAAEGKSNPSKPTPQIDSHAKKQKSPQNRNIVIGIGAAAVMIIGVALFLSSNDPMTTPETSTIALDVPTSPPSENNLSSQSELRTSEPSRENQTSEQPPSGEVETSIPTDLAEAESTDSSLENSDATQVILSEPAFVSPATPELIIASDSIPVEVELPEDERPAVVLESPIASSALSEVQTAAASEAETSTLAEKSIAILPLNNLSADPENAYFAAGIHEEILGQLSKISELRVISRRSVLQYEDTTESISDIAEDLNVAAVMEGSVRFAGNRVRITCQLINASNDTPIWSETYERELEDIFAIQSDVALQAANAMEASLLPDEISRIESVATDNTEAYTLYLRTLYRAEQQNYAVSNNPDGWITQGIEDLERAIELDPNFAAAYARLAYVQSFNGISRVFEANNALTEQSALENAAKAIELDPTLSNAYSVLAISAIVNRRWDEFLDHANKILAFPDIETTTYTDLAIGFAVIQRYEKSQELIGLAIESDPNSASTRWLGILVAVVSRDYQNVLTLAEQYRALGGDVNSYHLYRAVAFEFLERFDEANEALRNIQGNLTDQEFGFYPFYSYLNCKRGEQASMQLFAAQQTLFNLTLANIGCRIALGDMEGIYQIVQTLMLTGTAFPDFGELFDELRADPRFQEIEDYMALPADSD